MDLRHLRYFFAVADELSVTKAAKLLRLAQPSLTRQIKNLEEELNVTLFQRDKRRLTLTDDGRFFLARARRLLSQTEEEDMDDLRSRNMGEFKPLKIGYMLDMQYDLLPVMMAAFRKVWPRVPLNLVEMTAAEQIQALHKDKIQIGFAREPGLPSLAGLQNDVLTKCKIMAALPDTYPIKKGKKLGLGDLAGQPFISLLEMDVTLLPESCLRLPHEGTVFHPLHEVVYSKTRLIWCKENFSKPLQHYIRIVNDCFEGRQEPHVKDLPKSLLEKKLARDGVLRDAGLMTGCFSPSQRSIRTTPSGRPFV